MLKRIIKVLYFRYKFVPILKIMQYNLVVLEVGKTNF